MRVISGKTKENISWRTAFERGWNADRFAILGLLLIAHGLIDVQDHVTHVSYITTAARFDRLVASMTAHPNHTLLVAVPLSFFINLQKLDVEILKPKAPLSLTSYLHADVCAQIIQKREAEAKKVAAQEAKEAKKVAAAEASEAKKAMTPEQKKVAALARKQSKDQRSNSRKNTSTSSSISASTSSPSSSTNASLDMDVEFDNVNLEIDVDLDREDADADADAGGKRSGAVKANSKSTYASKPIIDASNADLASVLYSVLTEVTVMEITSITDPTTLVEVLIVLRPKSMQQLVSSVPYFSLFSLDDVCRTLFAERIFPLFNDHRADVDML